MHSLEFSNRFKGIFIFRYDLHQKQHTVYTHLTLIFLFLLRASLVAQMVKNLPAMQETQVQSLGWEDPLEEGMQTTPAFLPGEFHGQKSLARYSPWGHKESDTTERLRHFKTSLRLPVSTCLAHLSLNLAAQHLWFISCLLAPVSTLLSFQGFLFRSRFSIQSKHFYSTFRPSCTYWLISIF